MEVTYANRFTPKDYAKAAYSARALGELTRAAVWLGSPYALRSIALTPDYMRIDTARELSDVDAEQILEGLNAALRAVAHATDVLPPYLGGKP